MTADGSVQVYPSTSVSCCRRLQWFRRGGRQVTVAAWDPETVQNNISVPTGSKASLRHHNKCVPNCRCPVFHFCSLSLLPHCLSRICQGLTFLHRLHRITPNAPSKERSSLCYFLSSPRPPFSFIRSLFLNVNIFNLSIRHRSVWLRDPAVLPPEKFSRYPSDREMGQGCTNARRLNFCSVASVCFG